MVRATRDVGEMIRFQLWNFSYRVQERNLFSIRELCVDGVCTRVLYIVDVLRRFRTNWM